DAVVQLPQEPPEGPPQARLTQGMPEGVCEHELGCGAYASRGNDQAAHASRGETRFHVQWLATELAQRAAAYHVCRAGDPRTQANGTQPVMHEQPLVHDLVAGQAQRFPDALAVAARDARLTYRELQTRANQLAHLLRASEVGAEVTVGLCLPRSAALTVAALGIVESGGAYVALDPESPLQRLEFMLDDASALAVVTTPALAPSLDSGKRTVIALDP